MCLNLQSVGLELWEVRQRSGQTQSSFLKRGCGGSQGKNWGNKQWGEEYQFNRIMSNSWRTRLCLCDADMLQVSSLWFVRIVSTLKKLNAIFKMTSIDSHLKVGIHELTENDRGADGSKKAVMRWKESRRHFVKRKTKPFFIVIFPAAQWGDMSVCLGLICLLGLMSIYWAWECSLSAVMNHFIIHYPSADVGCQVCKLSN